MKITFIPETIKKCYCTIDKKMTNNFQPFSPLSEPIPLSPQSNLSRQSSNTQGLFIPNSSHSFSNTNFQNLKWINF